jgi:dGTPase
LTLPPEEVRTTLDERLVKEPPPSIRSEAQRDRDRILYSSALLRLGHITQVAAPEVGHIFHSRLTHSMKVAQVARGLAQRQKQLAEDGELDPKAKELVTDLDEDATEAAALAHDIGHPPFGHLAERVLQERSAAAFEGNPQSFRIVTRLALRSVNVPGLNLTKRTLNGLLKYPWLRAEEPPQRSEKWGAYDGDRKAFEDVREGLKVGERTLEAWLMDWADDVTYAVHDLDDFYRAGLVPLERLTATDKQELKRFQDYLRSKAERLTRADAEDGEETVVDPERYAQAAEHLFSGFVSSIRLPFSGKTEERVNLRQLGSTLIGRYIASLNLSDAEDGRVILKIPDEVYDQIKVLKQLTWFYVIERPSLAVMQRGQEKVIDTLYTLYRDAKDGGDIHVFPPVFQERLELAQSPTIKERVIVDLIAGMTESSALEIYRQAEAIRDGSLMIRAAGPA